MKKSPVLSLFLIAFCLVAEGIGSIPPEQNKIATNKDKLVVVAVQGRVSAAQGRAL